MTGSSVWINLAVVLLTILSSLYPGIFMVSTKLIVHKPFNRKLMVPCKINPQLCIPECCTQFIIYWQCNVCTVLCNQYPKCCTHATHRQCAVCLLCLSIQHIVSMPPIYIFVCSTPSISKVPDPCHPQMACCIVPRRQYPAGCTNAPNPHALKIHGAVSISVQDPDPLRFITSGLPGSVFIIICYGPRSESGSFLFLSTIVISNWQYKVLFCSY